jgi:hypothetical protein
VPKGRPYREWKAGYVHLLATELPPGTPWLMIAPGTPKDARRAHTPNATMFPQTQNGQPFVDDLAHIAHLEALRFEGHKYLVLPEGSRPWFQQQVEFRDHVATHYRVLVDTPHAGVVFDLAQQPEARATSVLGAVSDLAAERADPPAVLNWTACEIEQELPGITTFRAPTDDELPYLDHTVDVVIAEETRDIGEARRVANAGVIVVAQRASRLEVRAVEANECRARETARVVVWSPEVGDEQWHRRLAQCTAEAGAELRMAPIDARLAEVRHDDVTIALEPFVLPLPGVIARAASVVADRRDVAHTGKVLRADGRLEGAGGTVFFDRSTALIASQSEDVRAPWHEYVRPVCWAPGFVIASGSLWRSVATDNGLEGRAFIREWCAALWEKGGELIYQPSLASVRVRGQGDEPSTPLGASSWQRVLDLRPHRPADLNDRTWQYLLAHDDVQVGGV